MNPKQMKTIIRYLFCIVAVSNTAMALVMIGSTGNRFCAFVCHQSCRDLNLIGLSQQHLVCTKPIAAKYSWYLVYYFFALYLIFNML